MEHRDDRSLAAGAQVVNILQGTPFEFVQRRPAAIMVYSVSDPPGAGDEGELLLTVLFGTVIVCQRLPIPAFTAGQGPNRDQHLMVSGVAAPGDRIVIGLDSIAAAAYRVRTLVTIRPL